jgi:hypothetical protein
MGGGGGADGGAFGYGSAAGQGMMMAPRMFGPTSGGGMLGGTHPQFGGAGGGPGGPGSGPSGMGMMGMNMNHMNMNMGMGGMGPMSMNLPVTGSSNVVGGAGGRQVPSGGAGLSMMQNSDREEELLLQLLYARRRRAQQEVALQQDFGATTGGAGGDEPLPTDRTSTFADELFRLRQAGNAAAASSAATAAMFSSGSDPDGAGNSAMAQFQQQQQQQQHHHQLQQQQHHQFQQQGGFGGAGAGPNSGGHPMFSHPGGLNMNLGGAAPFGMMSSDHHPMQGLVPSALGGNAFGGTSRGLDDYLLRTQQQQHLPQDSFLGGMMPSADQQHQRIELSPSRFLAMQQQQQGGIPPSFMDLSAGGGVAGGGGGGQRSLKRGGEDTKMMELEGLDKAQGKHASSKQKKRFHKKKPTDMPRRPLSAYNLFFSEERERILREIDGKDGGGEEGPDDAKAEQQGEKAGDVVGEDDTKKPKALLRPLLPSEKKRRPHRKTHGKISFRLLAQMVGQRWKSLPDDERKYYKDLATEDMARQKKAMEEYYLKQSDSAKTADDNDEPNNDDGPDEEDEEEEEDEKESSVQESKESGTPHKVAT